MLTCNVVKDLLPNYIDELVSEETAREIAEHLTGCADCRIVYEQMKAPIEAAPLQSNAKEVNFLKKIKRKTLRVKIVAGALAAVLITFGVLVWVFAIGTPVNSDNVIITTEIIKSPGADAYLEQEWAMHFELTNGKAIVPHKELVYSTGADGSEIETGFVISLYEVQATNWLHEADNYAIGYFVPGDEAPTTDHTITVRLKDRDIVYSMNDEGLFEPQNEHANTILDFVK